MRLAMLNSNKKSEIDWYITRRIRELRIQKGLLQEDISLHLNISTGFIGHVESPNFRAKYNTVHLNELAKLLDCSPKEFWPELPL